MPALADALDRPLVTDVVVIVFDDGMIEATREMYGGKVKTLVEGDAESAVVTVRLTKWSPAVASDDATDESFDATVGEDAIGSCVTGDEEAASGDVDDPEADILVSVGR